MIAAAIAFKRGGFEQTCLLCRDPDHAHLREPWGCDGPTEHAQFIIECPFCEGQLKDCPECKGTNQIEYFDCPNKIVEQSSLDVCTAASFFQAGGALPAEGGWMDQAATLIDAMVLVLREKEVYDEERARHAANRT